MNGLLTPGPRQMAPQQGGQPGMPQGMRPGMPQGMPPGGQQDFRQAMANEVSFKIGMEEAAIDRQQLRLDTAKLVKQTDEDIQEQGEFTSKVRLAMEQVQQPMEFKTLQKEALTEAVQKGYVQPDDYEKLARLDPEKFKKALDFRVMQLAKVKQYKETPKDGVVRSPSGDVIARAEPINYAKPTASVKTSTQKDIITAEDNIKELSQMYSEVPDNFFGAGAAINRGAAFGREWVATLPGMSWADSSPEQKRYLEKYSNFVARSEMLSLQIIKQLSGVQYSDKQLEFMKKILPSIGGDTVKSEFKGRSSNMMRFFKQIKSDREAILREGVSQGSKEYREKMLQKMQSAAMQVNEQKEPTTLDKNQVEAYMKAYGPGGSKGTNWPREKVMRALKAKGLIGE